MDKRRTSIREIISVMMIISFKLVSPLAQTAGGNTDAKTK